MKKLDSETNGDPTEEPKGFLSNARRFFGNIFGKGKPITKDEKPKIDKNVENQNATDDRGFPLKKPENKPSNDPKPSFNPQTTIKPVKKTTKEVPLPIIEAKAKPKKIENLDHLDMATLIEKMTGEKLPDEELAKIKTVSAEKEEITEKPKNKGEILKSYPENPQDELDLHGKTSIEAEREIRSFVLSAKRRSMRTVRIITGKGLHSKEGQAVLRDIAEDKAVELKREGLVFSHKWERGGGALLVYLA